LDRLSTLGKLYAKDIPLYLFSPNFPQLDYGAVPREALPVKRWREVMQNLSRPTQFRHFKYEMEVLGRSELRQALVLHLNRSHNLACSVNEISVFNISANAVELLCQLLLEPNDIIAVENPGFGGIKNIALYQQIGLAPVAVDDEGLIVEELDKLPRVPKLIYVTPSSQDPTGVPMSLSRRMQLLAWSVRNHAWIIEDDYDGYFRQEKKDLPSLKSLATSNNVIYVSSFWQVLYPLTTTSFIVAPENLMAVMERSKAQGFGITETMVQLVLAEMLSDGYFYKHIRKWDKIFSGRRRALCYELNQALGERVFIPNQSGGLNCLVRIDAWSSESILACADRAGLPMVSTEDFYLINKRRDEFLVRFATQSEEQLKMTVKRFVRLLKSESAHRSEPT
jgi:GntR family transcriptional regulator/MocR family aminotransferase